MAVISADVESLKQYLQMQVDLIRRTCRATNDYVNCSDFILQNGHPFIPAPLPKDISRGIMKECFRNAFMLMAAHSELIYVEGYASGVIPVYHAWCVDQKGKVVDPTWGDDGQVYFGVPFSSGFVREQTLKSKKYGLIDAWDQHWPLFSMEKDLWIHPTYA